MRSLVMLHNRHLPQATYKNVAYRRALAPVLAAEQFFLLLIRRSNAMRQLATVDVMKKSTAIG